MILWMIMVMIMMMKIMDHNLKTNFITKILQMLQWLTEVADHMMMKKIFLMKAVN